MIQLSSCDVDESILLASVYSCRYADCIGLSFGLVRSPDERFCRSAIGALRSWEREDDEALLPLRLLWHRQAEDAVYVLPA